MNKIFWMKLGLLGIFLSVTGCGVVSIEDICLLDISKCPANTGTVTKYSSTPAGVLGAAELTLSGALPYNFGNVTSGGGTATYPFIVTNIGTNTATLGTITSIGLDLSGDYSLLPSGTTCITGQTLAVNATCVLNIEYAPTSIGSASAMSITLGYGDLVGELTLNSRHLVRELEGAGIAPASLAITGTSAFGSVALGDHPPDFILTVTNHGSSTATYSVPTTASLGLVAPFSLVSTTCGTSLGSVEVCSLTNVRACNTVFTPSNTCNLVIRYRPTVAQIDSQFMTLTYNNGAVAGNSANKAVSGDGVDVVL